MFSMASVFEFWFRNSSVGLVAILQTTNNSVAFADVLLDPILTSVLE